VPSNSRGSRSAGEPPSKGERTRQRILATAGDLIHARGLNAASLGDVLRASRVGKGQLYQHFTGRDDLVRQVLQGHRAYLARIRTPIASWADLRRWMDQHLASQRAFAFARGCPVGTAAYALQPDQTAVRAELQRIFDEMRQPIAAFLRQEQRAGRLAPRANPSRLADFAVACVQGGLLLGVLERRARPVKRAIDEGFAHLRSFAREAASS
jgi:TetR/AcrR family transcriptional repressor of nem operon